MLNLISPSNTGLRKRYIISFILVSIIPTIIISLLYLPIINLFRAEAIKTDTAMTNTVRAIIDQRALELYNLSVQISTNKTVREFLYKKAPLNNYGRYYIKDISDSIQSYKAGNSFVSLVAVYLIQSSSIVTNQGAYDADYFFENVLKYDDMTTFEIKQIMQEVHYNKYLPKKKISGNGPLDGEYITYIQTIPIGEKKALANVIMFIDQENIFSMIGDNRRNVNQHIIILTKDGDRIYSRAEDEKIIRQFMDKIENGDNSFVMGIDENTGETNMLVSYSISQVNDWVYIVISSMDNIVAKMSKIRNFAIIIAITSLGVGVLISVFMADSNYRPWVNLIDQIKEYYKVKSTGGTKSSNEYVFAMNAINSMIMEREQLQKYINKGILRDLCSGKAVAIDNDKKNFIFPYKSYCVIIVDMDDKAQLNSKLEKLLNKLVGIYFHNSIIYTFEHEKERLSIVLNTESHGTTLIIEQIRRLKDIIDKHLDALLYVGIGNVYESVDKLHESYKEAKKALEYCFLKGRDSVVFYPEIRKYIVNSLNLPIYSDNPLLNCVKTGDIKNCVKLLDEYFSNIANTGSASIQYMYCLFYSFVSIIIKACSEINVDFENIFNQTPEQILDIDKYRNPKQIINSVYDIYTTMCDYIQRNIKSQNISLKNHIDTYIQENYTNPLISLNQLADRFGYSASYLSRFIKQEFGVGFGELINKKRLGYAKELLASELISISEISEKVGYTSINSFTRAFKRQEGISPSQYRNISLMQNRKTV